MLPAWSTMSKCTVSPTTSPMRPTVGSPAPMPATSLAPGLSLTIAPKPSTEPGRSSSEALFGHELAALGVVGVRQQRRERHLDEVRIAVELLAVGIGELRAFHHQVDEIRPDHVHAVEIEALEQRELLQHHRPLAPRRLADGVAAVVVGERRLDRAPAISPCRAPVSTPECGVPLVSITFCVRQNLSIASRDEALRPDLSRLLDLRDAVAAGALGFLQHARVGRGQRLVGEQLAGLRHGLPSRQIDRRRRRPVLAEQLLDRADGGVGALDQRMAVLRIARSRASARRRASSCRSRAGAASRCRTCRGCRPRAGRCPAPCRGLRCL